MAEYEINVVSDEEPRVWEGPNGKVYYINVGLAGHPKPVSIGKKSPDALKVGDKVYGEIVPTEFPTDKWKAGQNPEYAGKPAYNGPKRSGFSPAERNQLMDRDKVWL